MAEYTDAAPASSTGTFDPTTTSAGTENTEQGGAQQQDSRYVPYTRFAEVNGNWRAAQAEAQGLRQQLEQAQAYLQQMQQLRAQPAQTGRSLTAQEQQEMQVAAVALKRLLASDPDLAHLLTLRQQLPGLMQGAQTATQLQQAQQQQIIASGQARLAELAQTAGIPQQAQSYIEDLVTGIIGRSPEATQRFRQGDPAIVPWAFDQAQKQFFSHFARQATQQVAQTKARMATLPPRPGGGLPAGEAPPRWDKDDPASMGKVHAAAFARIRQIQEAQAAGA